LHPDREHLQELVLGHGSRTLASISRWLGEISLKARKSPPDQTCVTTTASTKPFQSAARGEVTEVRETCEDEEEPWLVARKATKWAGGSLQSPSGGLPWFTQLTL
jgi:hypothetical protein